MEQHVTFRRVAGMLVGIVIISLGVALFKFAHLGNDPFNALNIRSAELAGLTLGVQNLIYNAVFFTMQMIWGRRYVGFGTVANAVCCGFIITFFYDFLTAHFAQAAPLPAQLAWVAAAVVCTSLGISLHQTSDLGVAPYDYLALGLRDHTPLPYFCCRLFADTLCALLAFFAGRAAGAGHPDLCVLPGTADPVFQHPCFRKRVAICSNRAAGIIFTSGAIIILQRRQLWLAAAFGCLMAFYLNLV